MTLCPSCSPWAGDCDALSPLLSLGWGLSPSVPPALPQAEGRAQVFFLGKGPWATASAQPSSCRPGGRAPRIPVCLVTGPRPWEDGETVEAAVTPKECPLLGRRPEKVFCRRPAEAKGSPLLSSAWPVQHSLAMTFSTHFLNAYFCCVHSWACKHLWLFKTGVLVKSEVSSKKPSPQDRMTCPGKAGRRGGGAEMSSEAVAWVVSCSGAPRDPVFGAAEQDDGGPSPPPELAPTETPGRGRWPLPRQLSQRLPYCSGEAPRVVRSAGTSRGRWRSRQGSPEPWSSQRWRRHLGQELPFLWLLSWAAFLPRLWE